MVQFLAVVFGIILVSIPAMAQIYNGKDQEVKAPLDRAVAESNAMYANVEKAGAAEDRKTQEARYYEMTNAVNQANEHHFEMNRNVIK
ncbi:MAG: hypothetical protein HQL22_01685 [Candidatus Omnitrophica bacterium]|nr:hypothetical protein [Candidatus Omnitrophota bacterium]